ncbi:MAG: hypothetical protein V3R99_02915 [Thermoguttaceae bacterium]
MKRFGSGVVIVAVAVILASLLAARAIPRQDLLPQSLETLRLETLPSGTVIDEAQIDQTADGCSPIPPTPKPTATVSTNQPTLAPPESSALAAQATYERHPRGQVISVRVEVEGTP